MQEWMSVSCDVWLNCSRTQSCAEMHANTWIMCYTEKLGQAVSDLTNFYGLSSLAVSFLVFCKTRRPS